jgi:hypothetical protein
MFTFCDLSLIDVRMSQINNAAESARFEEETIGLQNAGGDLFGGDTLRG